MGYFRQISALAPAWVPSWVYALLLFVAILAAGWPWRRCAAMARSSWGVNLIAGLQLAFTQPVRIGDAVEINNETARSRRSARSIS
jgi:hypothetical protein